MRTIELITGTNKKEKRQKFKSHHAYIVWFDTEKEYRILIRGDKEDIVIYPSGLIGGSTQNFSDSDYELIEEIKFNPDFKNQLSE